MRTFLNIALEVLTSLFFAAAIAIGAGAAATSFTHRLGDGLRAAAVAFIAASACFGHVIWRTYRPLEKVPANHGARPVGAASSR